MTSTRRSSLLVGLTGGIGSGKSTVAKYFNDLGIFAVDADIVAREVVAPGTVLLSQIISKFGTQMLQHDGQLNRAALRQRIFQDTAAKQWLEALLHPAIRTEMLAQLATSQTPYSLLIAPLLLENGLDTLVHRTLVIDVTEQTQLQRAAERDGGNVTQIQAIMAAQISRPDRLARADDVIDNNGSPAELLQQVTQLHKKYLELSAEMRHK